VPYILSNGEEDAGQSTQPVTLHLTIAVSTIMASPIFFDNSPEMPTERDDTPAEEATKPFVALNSGGPSHSTSREPVSPSPDPLPVETGTPISTEKALIAVRSADEAKKTIDRVNTWKRAISRIKWVMNTVSPIAEVRAISILPLLN